MFNNDDLTKAIGVSCVVVGSFITLLAFGTYSYRLGVYSGANALRAAAEVAGETDAFEKIVAAVGKIPVK